MDITLVQLISHWEVKPQERLLLPVGILTLASYVKKHGHSASLVDLNCLIKKRLLRYDKNFIKRSAKYIIARGPAAIGFNVLCCNLPLALLIARECKRLKPDCFIILGGPEVSFEAGSLLGSFRQVDAIIRSEGEGSLVELLDSLGAKSDLKHVNGVSYRKNEKVISNPPSVFIEDLDSLPYPNFKLLPYFNEYKSGALEGGRGCPFRCTFCSTSRMWGRHFRIKTPLRLAKELQYVHSHFRNKAGSTAQRPINIIHDNFLARRQNALRFFFLISGKRLPWTGSARLDALDAEMIRGLSKSSCRGLFIGIETASPRLSKIIKKNLRLEKLADTLEQLLDNDLEISLSFIIGLPGETIADANRTLWCALMSRLSSPAPEILINLLALLKGSDLYYLWLAKMRRNRLSLRLKMNRIDHDKLYALFPETKRMISQHPGLFPYFYYPDNIKFDFEELHKLTLIFQFLTECFPVTTILFIKHLKTEPFSFGRKILKAFEKYRVCWQSYSDPIDFYDHYLPFFLRFVKRHKINAVIKTALKHERLFHEICLKANGSQAGSIKVKPASLPRKSPGARLVNYDYNILSIIASLKNKKYDIKKEKTTLAYLPGKDSRAIVIAPLSKNLLALCNGKRRVREILQFGSESKLDKKGRQAAKKIILSAFDYLAENGLITI